MRTSKTKSVNLRIPLEVHTRIAEEASSRGISVYRRLLELIEGKKFYPAPPGQHEYPIALKSHIEGDMAADKYGNAYILIGDKFEYKEPEK
jgi:hypothetical protein